jgi:perosamine synthetase
MLLTDSDVVFQRVLTLRDHGRDTSTGKMFWNSEVAYKYKMSSMQAALGLAQLERIEELVSKKRQIFEWYQKYLINVPVTLNYQADNVLSTYWMVTAIQEPTNFISKEVLIAAMRERKIDCRPFFYPLSSLPAYADLDHGWEDKNPVSYSLSKTGINLPSGLSLTEDDVKVVCAGFAAVLNAVKGS